MSDYVSQLINEAKEKKLTRLDLGNLGLKKIPPEVFELDWLEELILADTYFDDDKQIWVGSRNRYQRNAITFIQANISKLKKLNYLYLHYNQITSIKPLLPLRNLKRLLLTGQNISDLILIEQFPNLKDITLAAKTSAVIKVVKRMKHLRWLGLDQVSVDLSFLKDFHNLEVLHINDSPKFVIEYLKFIPGERLKELQLSGVNVVGINVLGRFSRLERLYISNNRIRNINVLQKLRTLTLLEFSSNAVKDISALQFLPNLQLLAFSHNNVEDISPVKGLARLKQMYCGGNPIKNFEAIRKLPEIELLDSYKTGISDISFLKGMPKLEKLYLDANKIKDITALESLSNLSYLDISRNKIEVIDALRNLKGLKTLNAASNKIADLSPLTALGNIIYMNLSYNVIKDITPLRKYFENGFDTKVISELYVREQKMIFLEQNPLLTPPAEIVQKGREAILNYYKELKAQGTESLYETKLLILGEGGAGKTTLARKLQDAEAPMPAEKESTKGISIHPLIFTTAGGHHFRLNIWDFGGQEIYHATHQFFLTKRSLYVLLDDTRKDDKSVNDASFNYWLQVAGLFGGGSPLLIVQNEKSDRSKQLDMSSMQSRFDFIKDKLAANLLTGRGLSEIKETIQFHSQRLQHIGESLPKQWVIIRNELEELSKIKDYISLEEYLSICAKYGLKEEDRALLLSGYLHDLGIFLHFQDGSVLQGIFILNNQWATDAVYKVLDNENVKSKFGQFTIGDLNQIWMDVKYKFRHNELLALMMKFELCYELSDDKDVAWLAPQLLPIETPGSLKWDKKNNLIIRYEYEFMPKGLLSRFMVRIHRYITNRSLAWRSGVVLERANTKALITETYGNREIVIQVKGSQTKELVTIVTEEFDQMHKRFDNLRVKKFVPCNCDECSSREVPHFYEYDDLATRKEKKITEIECKFSYRRVKVQSLLDGIFAIINEECNVYDTASKPLKVFLSYAHKDEKIKDKLNSHLSALRKANKIDVWHDRKLKSGESWDDNIRKELNEADVILLLISSDFLDSRYIWDVEIKTAIERHHRNETRVIPIFVRECDYKGMPFEKLQGFPRDAKPITSYSQRDKAYAEIATGIREDIDDWSKAML